MAGKTEIDVVIECLAECEQALSRQSDVLCLAGLKSVKLQSTSNCFFLLDLRAT